MNEQRLWRSIGNRITRSSVNGDFGGAEDDLNPERAAAYLNALEAENAALKAERENGVRDSWLYRQAEQQIKELSDIIAQKYEEVGQFAAEVAALKAALNWTYDSLRDLRDQQVDSGRLLQPLIDCVESALAAKKETQ